MAVSTEAEAIELGFAQLVRIGEIGKAVEMAEKPAEFGGMAAEFGEKAAEFGGMAAEFGEKAAEPGEKAEKIVWLQGQAVGKKGQL